MHITPTVRGFLYGIPSLKKEKNVHIRPINNDAFIDSMITCAGMLCGAGFETPAEALFLKKKLMVIPMKGQYEQQCNAAALQTMGLPVIKSLKEKHLEKIQAWTKSKQIISVNYPNITEKVINNIIKQHPVTAIPPAVALGDAAYSAKKLKAISLGNILNQIGG